MEPTFYEEQYRIQQQLPPEKLQEMKHNLRLDIKSVMLGKKYKNEPAQPVLSSPDLNMLKLGSPELEKFITDHQNGVQDDGFLFQAKSEEPETYTKGFEDALSVLYQSNDSCENSQSSESVYLQMDYEDRCYSAEITNPGPSTSKNFNEEPQTVPSLWNVDPAEQAKLEKKRLRNRVAASKCRKRKLERISLLEEKVRILKKENSHLEHLRDQYKNQIREGLQELLLHIQSGCAVQIPASLQ